MKTEQEQITDVSLDGHEIKYFKTPSLEVTLAAIRNDK